MTVLTLQGSSSRAHLADGRYSGIPVMTCGLWYTHRPLPHTLVQLSLVQLTGMHQALESDFGHLLERFKCVAGSLAKLPSV